MHLWAWQCAVPLSPLLTLKSPFLSELWGCVLWQNVRQLNSHGSLSWRWARSSRLLYRQQKKRTQATPCHPFLILWLSNLAVNPNKKFLSKDTLNYCQLAEGWASLSLVIIPHQNVNEDSLWDEKHAPLQGISSCPRSVGPPAGCRCCQHNERHDKAVRKRQVLFLHILLLYSYTGMKNKYQAAVSVKTWILKKGFRQNQSLHCDFFSGETSL